MFLTARPPSFLGATALALPILAIATAHTAGPEKVTIEYRSGLSCETRITSANTLRLGESSMLVGGEEFPADMMASSVPDRDGTQTVVLRDVVREAADGRVTVVAREFVELTKEQTASDESTKESGALEGSTLVLSLGDDGEVEAEAADDAEGDLDHVFLVGHRVEHAAAGMLPDDEVEPGATWTPSDAAVREFLIPGGPEYYEAENNQSLTALLDEDAELTAEVTFKEVADLDGVECYVLVIEAELEAEIDELPKHLRTGGSENKEGSIQVKGEFEAELWIAVEARFPVKLEIKSELQFDVQMLMDHQGMGIEINMELMVTKQTDTEWDLLESGR